MQEKMIIFSFHIQGAASSGAIAWQMPCAATLWEVSAVASNVATTGTLQVGKTGTAEEYVKAFAIGSSGVPSVIYPSEQVDEQPMHIPDNTDMLLTITAGGTPPEDTTIVVTMLTG